MQLGSREWFADFVDESCPRHVRAIQCARDALDARFPDRPDLVAALLDELEGFDRDFWKKRGKPEPRSDDHAFRKFVDRRALRRFVDSERAAKERGTRVRDDFGLSLDHKFNIVVARVLKHWFQVHTEAELRAKLLSLLRSGDKLHGARRIIAIVSDDDRLRIAVELSIRALVRESGIDERNARMIALHWWGATAAAVARELGTKPGTVYSARSRRNRFFAELDLQRVVRAIRRLQRMRKRSA